MTRDWSRERWRKLYVREPLKQQAWPVLARGLRDYLIRRAEDDGELATSKDELLDALAPKTWEREFVADAIDLLITDGFLVEDEAGIHVRNLPAAQGDDPSPRRTQRVPRTTEPTGGRWAGTTPETRAAAAKTAADARWGKRVASTHPGDASASHPVTHGDACDDASGDASSPRAVSGQDLSSGSLKEPARRDQLDQPDARPHAGTDAYGDAGSDASTHDARDACNRATRAPTNLEAALALTPHDRAKYAIRNEGTAGYLEPEQWPEVKAAVDAYRRATKQPGYATSTWDRDRGIQSVVALFAAEPMLLPSQIYAGIERWVRSSWYQERRDRLDLSSVTIKALRVALGQVEREAEDAERSRERLRRAEASIDRGKSQPETLGSLLPRVATGGTE